MGIDGRAETKRVSRYVIVKGFTKGGGTLAYGVVIIFVDENHYLYAYWAVAGITALVDFLGQKLWAFKNPALMSKKMIQDFWWYMGIRGSTILCTSATFLMLTEWFSVRTWVAILISLSIFVPVGFLLSRLLFHGTIRDVWSFLKTKTGFQK